MRIACLQMNCRLGEQERNVRRALQLIDSEKADLYVLPELFNSGYLFANKQEVVAVAEAIPEGETCRQLYAVAQKKECYIVAGMAEKAGDKFYNASVLIGPQGHIATYRKIHLFDEEKLWFDPGDKPFCVHDIGIAKLGLMICFDWIFPESMRSLALQGAEVICHSANLVLPYCQKAMTTRCLENGVFAATANRVGQDRCNDKQLRFTGHSQITGPRGQVLSQAGKVLEEVCVATIDPGDSQKKWLNSHNHLHRDRRPEMYKS
jgi:predicted amidohydrolase